jgi:hypothetical protein
MVMTPRATPQTGDEDVHPDSHAMITRSLAAALGRTPGPAEQNAPFCTLELTITKCAASAHSGSARGYQAIFVPSTALASPGYHGQPAVNLYIAALKVNVLN